MGNIKLETLKMKVADVIYREDLYPRIKADPETISKYSDNLDVLPPIEVNQNNELIDGFHRWQAHKKNDINEISVQVTKTSSDAELLTLAIERNSAHGLQLSAEDKKNMAVKIYSATAEKERIDKKKELAGILSVTQRTITGWVSDIDKDARKQRKKKIFDMWLSCHTQAEIGEAVGLSQNQITDNVSVISEMEKFPKPIQHAAEYALEDDSIPKFTVWSFGSKTNKIGHFGNSEQTIVDWLLYLYTEPFSVVVDPFAGGGATIDICRLRLRRFWVGDRIPSPTRPGDIRQHDIIGEDGSIQIPDLKGRWKDVSLIYLDPPYWKQAFEKYSKDKNDLANMDLDTFHDSLTQIINQFSDKAPNAHIALLMQPTQWASGPGHEFTDHVFAIAPKIKAPVSVRIQAPYQKASCTPVMYEWSEANKKLLVLSREIVVWGPKK